MPAPPGHPLRRTLQPLFGFDHVARGEPLFAAPILAERNQLGRGFDSSHYGIELFLAVAMPMHEHGKVAIRSEEHTSELQSLMRISYAVFCLKKKNKTQKKEHL